MRFSNCFLQVLGLTVRERNNKNIIPEQIFFPLLCTNHMNNAHTKLMVCNRNNAKLGKTVGYYMVSRNAPKVSTKYNALKILFYVICAHFYFNYWNRF